MVVHASRAWVIRPHRLVVDADGRNLAPGLSRGFVPSDPRDRMEVLRLLGRGPTTLTGVRGRLPGWPPLPDLLADQLDRRVLGEELEGEGLDVADLWIVQDQRFAALVEQVCRAEQSADGGGGEELHSRQVYR